MIDVGTIKVGDKRIAAWSYEPGTHDDPYAYTVKVVSSASDDFGIEVIERIYHAGEFLRYDPGNTFHMTGHGLFNNMTQAKSAIIQSYFGLSLRKNVTFKREE